MTYDLEGGLTEHEVLPVGKSLRGSNDDGVTGVDTEGIEVLHITDGNAVVTSVTDDLVLELLPSTKIAIDDDLATVGKGLGGKSLHLSIIRGETRTKTTKSEGSTDEDGVADLVLGNIHGLIHGGGGVGLGNSLVDLSKLLAEDFTILGGLNDIDLRAEDLNTLLLQLAGLPELNTDVQSGLSTHGNNDTVGTLFADDVHNNVGLNGEEVDLVSTHGVVLLLLTGLDGGNVGVDQNDLDALLLEGLDALTAGVVELTGLADAETATTDEKDPLVHLALVSQTVLEDDGLGNLADVSDELLEEEGRVGRSAAGLGVELHTEEGLIGVDDTLVGQIIGIHEQRLPHGWEGVGIDGEAVVLGGDVAPSGAEVDAGLVHTAVTVLKLVRGGTGGKRQQLVTQTDTKDGTGRVEGQGILDGLDGGGTHGRITGTIGKEQTLPLNVFGVGLEIVVEGNDGELHLVRLDEVTDDVELHTAIVSNDAGLVALAIDLDGLGRDLGDEVSLVGVLEFWHGLGQVGGGVLYTQPEHRFCDIYVR